MNRRISFLVVVLAVAGILTVHGAFSQVTIQPTRKAINLPGKDATDLSLFEKFNPIYKSYFTTKNLPAREFIGAGSLLRGGHFELQAIAVKR